MGTGNACAWQSRAKLVDISLTNVKLLDSPEKVGALAPTGSTKRITKYFLWSYYGIGLMSI